MIECIDIANLGNALTAFPKDIDPREDLQYFSWWAYLFVALAYTTLVFWAEFKTERRHIFAGDNARSFLQILIGHFAYVTVLLCVLRSASYTLPWMPLWMTNKFSVPRGTRASVADFAFAPIGLIMIHFERKLLYVKREE
jgi:hypothetical protein